MTPARRGALLRFVFGRVRWRLTLSYLAVTLAAIFLLGWWGLVVGTVQLQRANPTQSGLEVIRNQIVPAMGVILPGALILILPVTLVSVYFGFLNARWIDIRLANLRRATQAWQRGDFSVKVTDEAADEISDFGQELNRMAGDLEQLLIARGELVALEERNHLARDLHDSVKQQITAAMFQIGAANAWLGQNLEAARACLVEAENLTQAAHQELNSIIFELRPAAHHPGTLAQALRDYTAGWARQNPIEVHLEIRGERDLDPAIQQDIVRFTQEALSNVARHSHAKRVELELTASETAIRMTIRDDGCGFETQSGAEKGMGLKSMRERVTRAGGQFSLISHPQKGTQVTATLPQIATRETDGKDA